MTFRQFREVFSGLLDGNVAGWNYFTQFNHGLSEEAKQEQIEYIEEYIAASSEISPGNNTYLRGYINFLKGSHAEQIACYKEASALNNATAMVALAIIYKNPQTCKFYGITGTLEDLKQQAINLCEKAMEAGCLDATIVLADIYAYEHEHHRKGIELYQRASETSAYANVAYGNLLRRIGNNIQAEESYKNALKLDKNCTFALYSLGNLSKSMRLPDEAKQFFNAAAKLDDSNSMLALARMLLKDNVDEAEHFLKCAVELGNPWAMLQLAIILDRKGVNPEELYRRSATLGNPYAMDSLATFLQCKEPHDENEIIRLYKQAIKLGYEKSRKHLKAFREIQSPLTEVSPSDTSTAEDSDLETDPSSVATAPEQPNEPESVHIPIIDRYRKIVEQLRAIQFKKIKIITPISDDMQPQENPPSVADNQQIEDSPVEIGVKELICCLDNLHIKDTKVVEALEALYEYFKVIKKYQDGDTNLLYFAIKDAQTNFKEKISQLVGHPNELFNDIGIALVSLGGAILVALATTAGLGLIIPTTAIGASAAGAGIAATMVAVGLYGIFSSGVKEGSAYDKAQTVLSGITMVNRQTLISRADPNTHLIEELESPAPTMQ